MSGMAVFKGLGNVTQSLFITSLLFLTIQCFRDLEEKHAKQASPIAHSVAYRT